MKKTWKTTYEGTDISVINTFSTLKLQVDGKTQDVYWGIMAWQVRLWGSVHAQAKRHRIKVVVGPRWLTFDCAIFVDDELLFDSTEGRSP